MAKEVKATEGDTKRISVKYNHHGGEHITVSYSLSKPVVDRINRLAAAEGISKSRMLQNILMEGAQDCE